MRSRTAAMLQSTARCWGAPPFPGSFASEDVEPSPRSTGAVGVGDAAGAEGAPPDGPTMRSVELPMESTSKSWSGLSWTSRPFTRVPLALARSLTQSSPPRNSSRQWRRESSPSGRTMSFWSERPMSAPVLERANSRPFAGSDSTRRRKSLFMAPSIAGFRRCVTQSRGHSAILITWKRRGLPRG